jgi:restriction endonuclease S subunit
MSNISKERLGKLSIYLPPLELQNQFAAFVTQVNKSKLVEATTIIPKGGFLQWR